MGYIVNVKFEMGMSLLLYIAQSESSAIGTLPHEKILILVALDFIAHVPKHALNFIIYQLSVLVLPPLVLFILSYVLGWLRSIFLLSLLLGLLWLLLLLSLLLHRFRQVPPHPSLETEAWASSSRSLAALEEYPVAKHVENFSDEKKK